MPLPPPTDLPPGNLIRYPLRVLIVDDSPEDRLLYRRLLRRHPEKFEIIEAENAAGGLEAGEKQSIDCVVLDYYLPDSDGIDFIAAYQQRSRVPDAAIIMVTGQGDEKTAVEAMKSGALDYITKNSVSEGYLVQCIENAAERAGLRRQVELYQRHLEKSNRALSDFAHIVSHDLKAPLRRISSYCEFLKEETEGILPSEAARYVERLIVNAARMQQFIDDLLAFSRVMHSNEDMKPVDLSELVAGVIEDLDSLIEENGATVKVDPLPTLRVYPVRMRQVFQNLISNAIKYRGEAKPVVHVTYEATKTSHVFSVKDNGIGVDPQYQENIFKAFQRLHTQDEIEGTGLGLSIVKDVIAMHKGEAGVESTPGQGSRFYFTLRREDETAETPVSTSTYREAASSSRT